MGDPNCVQVAVPVGHGGAGEFAAAIDERGGSARASNSLANQIDIPEHVADGCLCSPVPRCELASLHLRDIARHRTYRENVAQDCRVDPRALGKMEGLDQARSEEHTSELQSLMRISYAVFGLKKKNNKLTHTKQTDSTYKQT